MAPDGCTYHRAVVAGEPLIYAIGTEAEEDTGGRDFGPLTVELPYTSR